MSALAGRRIVVTRRARQASRLARLLVERGATVLEVPAIEIVAPADTTLLDAALRSLSRYRFVAFTSANAVTAVADRMAALGIEPRLTASGAKLASVGAATTAALRSSFPADAVSIEPTRGSGAAALAETLTRADLAGARVLFPASSRAREELPRALEDAGAVVEQVVAYETVEPADLGERVQVCLDGGFDLIAFASPSAVEAFALAGSGRLAGRAAVAIGPTTAEAARAWGFEVVAVARPSTVEGLVETAEQALRLTASRSLH